MGLHFLMCALRLVILQVPTQGILTKDNLRTAAGRAYTFRAQDNDKINKKHVSFINRLVSDYSTTFIFSNTLTTING
jgi:hypothetical protein